LLIEKEWICQRGAMCFTHCPGCPGPKKETATFWGMPIVIDPSIPLDEVKIVEHNSTIHIIRVEKNES